MDDFEAILKEAEDEGVKANQALAKLLLNMWKSAKDDLKNATKTAKNLKWVAVISAVISAICLSMCIYFGVTMHNQQGQIEAIQKTLDNGIVFEETTTYKEETNTSQSVEGDQATINNGVWNNGYPDGEDE